MRSLQPIIYILLFATFLAKFSLFLALPFLSIYLMQEFKYSGIEIGMILSVAGVVSIVMSMFAGSIIDRFNKRQIIYIGLIITIISYLSFPFINSFFGFVMFSIVSTIGASFVDPTYRVLITMFTPQHKKKLVFNVRYYLINIAAALGPLTAGQIIFIGMENLFYIVSFCFMINLLMFVYVFNKFEFDISTPVSAEKVPFFNALYIFKKNRAFLYLVLGNIFIVFGYNQMSSTLTQYMGHLYPYEMAAKYYSYLLLVNAVTVLGGQYFIYQIGRKIPTSSAMVIGSVLLPLGLWVFGFSESFVVIGIGMFIFTIGEMLLFTMWDIRIDEISEPHLKGSYYSLTGLTGISRIIAPLAGGFLLDTTANGFMIFSILAGVSVIGVYCFIVSSRLTRKA
ncbi:MFS transporter [Macrococcus armenti]|uniref:MFS transporter n=1 Tax=Macrococcus armenti TaxID=2875764 RepID=UPI0030BA15CF